MQTLNCTGEPLNSEKEQADDLAFSSAKVHKNPKANCNQKFTRHVKKSNQLYVDENSKNMSNSIRITFQEGQKTIKNLKNGKSPGNDNINNKIINGPESKAFLVFSRAMEKSYPLRNLAKTGDSHRDTAP